MTEHLTDEQRARAIALIEDTPWGDTEGYIRAVEEALGQALAATAADYQRWDEYLGPALEEQGYDEYNVEPEMLEAMSDMNRLAYLSQVVRSLALMYGVSVEMTEVRRSDRGSPAFLLHGLNDIVNLPLTREERA